MSNTEKNNNEENIVVAASLIPDGRFIEAAGRRTRSAARVRIWENKCAKKAFIVNDRELFDYFPTEDSREMAKEALIKIKAQNRFAVSVRVHGGGFSAQADAVRHGLAKALAGLDGEWKKKVKKSEFLKPDVRIVERKKFGKKKARKSPQWSKR